MCGRDFDRINRESAQERWLESLPTCECCGQPIQQDTALHIGKDWYCDECVRDMYESLPDPDYD